MQAEVWVVEEINKVLGVHQRSGISGYHGEWWSTNWCWEDGLEAERALLGICRRRASCVRDVTPAGSGVQ